MKNIVACIDFSENTSAVIETALTLANVFKTRLYLLHVVDVDPGSMVYDGWVIPELTEKRMAAARENLDQLREPLREHGVDIVTVLLEDSGNTVHALLNEAQKLEAGILVAGSHGHGAFFSIVLGSTSEGLVRHARCPVLIVPAQRSAEHEAAGAQKQTVEKSCD